MKNLCFDFRLKSIDYQYQNGSAFIFFRLREPNILEQRYYKSIKQDCFDHDFVIGEISCEVSSYDSTYVIIIAWKTESTGYSKS